MVLAQSVKATVFGYYVSDPERYGVAEFNDNGDVISIEEKLCSCRIIFLSFWCGKKSERSPRGELEIKIT